MYKRLFRFAFLGLALSFAAQADELVVPSPAVSAAQLPERGMTQSAVAERFGEPGTRHAPVGGGHPKRPPITRWDYAGYAVFFENDRVVDVVVQGAPPPIQHVDELKTSP